MENWIEIFEYNQKEKDKIKWFLELLEEEKIPYKEEIQEKWQGRRIPIYQQNIIVYVPMEYKEKVEEFLKQYDNPNNIVYEDAEELRNISSEEEEQLKEIKKGRMARKMLAWIPIGMVIIVIICMIVSSVMY